MLTLEGLQASLAWFAPWMTPLLTVWDVPVSRAEAIAFIISLGMVLLNVRVNPWAWPLAITSAVLCGFVFAYSGLYGVAALQIVFVVLAVWGWYQWLKGEGDNGQQLVVRKLQRSGLWFCLLATVLLWGLCGYLLDHITDSTVPYFDALPTAGSIVGQWLLARKWVENWPCWFAVNVVSAILFATQGLWLSALLYAIFVALSVLGWREWLKLAAARQARA